MMDAPKTRHIFRKKLCLKSTLDTCKYDPIANVYYRDVVTTPPSKKLATVPPKAVDDFDDFKSPTKPASKPKKTVKSVKRRPRMSSMTYSYPEGCACTQDMFASAWNRPGAGNTDYLSENEFEIFRDERKREALLLSKAAYKNMPTSVKVVENPIEKKEKFDNSEEAKPTPLEPIISGMNDCIIESGEEKILIVSLAQGLTADNSVKSPPRPLRNRFSSPNDNASSWFKKKNTDYLRKIKIENIIIPDSDLSEDEVVCSQLPLSREVKTSENNGLSKNGEFKSSKDLNADKEISCATESATSLKSKSASLSISQNIAASDQMKVKKTNDKNVEMVALSGVDKLTEETAQFKIEPTLNTQNAEVHPTHRTSPTTMKRPLELCIQQYAKSEGRLGKLTTTYEPSQKSSKAFYVKKSRFSYVRSLRWKTRTYKRKRAIRLI